MVCGTVNRTISVSGRPSDAVETEIIAVFVGARIEEDEDPQTWETVVVGAHGSVCVHVRDVQDDARDTRAC